MPVVNNNDIQEFEEMYKDRQKKMEDMLARAHNLEQKIQQKVDQLHKQKIQQILHTIINIDD